MREDRTMNNRRVLAVLLFSSVVAFPAHGSALSPSIGPETTTPSPPAEPPGTVAPPANPESSSPILLIYKPTPLSTDGSTARRLAPRATGLPAAVPLSVFDFGPASKPSKPLV